MALLEFALDAVEVGGVEVVAVILLVGDIVVDCTLLNGARPVGVVSSMLVVVGHGGRELGRQVEWLVWGRGRRTQNKRAMPNARRGATEPQVRGGGELTRRRLEAVECI